METEIIDKLFLELSQVTTATTAREITLQRRIDALFDQVTSLKAELRARREAERRPGPCVAGWTDLECPKCGHEAVCRGRAGYHCTIDGCGWTKDVPVKPDPLSQALNEGDGTYRP